MNSRRNPFLALLLVSIFLLSACQTLYTGGITLTEVVKAAGDEYAYLRVMGKIPDATHAKVEVAWAKYQAAAGVAKTAFNAYKMGSGTESQAIAALEAARAAATGFFDLIAPLLTVEKSNELQVQLQKANAP